MVLLDSWGLTELTGAATVNRVDARRLGSVGRPIDGARIVVDREKGDDGVSGEIIVYGGQVMQGYHGRGNEAGDGLEADGSLRTGDLGRVDDDGFLGNTGRVKARLNLENGQYMPHNVLEVKIALRA